MAEPLSLVASVIAIIQISKTVIGICQFYIEEMKEAPSELRLMLVEISTLRAITKNLRFLVDPKTANPGLSNQLVGIDGPVEGCLRALKELEKELPHEAALLNGKGSKRRKVDVSTWVRALAWPLRVGKVKRLLQDIMLYKGTINLALTTDLAHDLKDVKQKTEQIHTILTGNYRPRRNFYSNLAQTLNVGKSTHGFKPPIHRTYIIGLKYFTKPELVLGCSEHLNGLSGSKESTDAYGFMVYPELESQS